VAANVQDGELMQHIEIFLDNNNILLSASEELTEMFQTDPIGVAYP